MFFLQLHMSRYELPTVDGNLEGHMIGQEKHNPAYPFVLGSWLE